MTVIINIRERELGGGVVCAGTFPFINKRHGC